jgi:hypothetical protein
MKNKTFHHAFRTDYSGIVRALVTELHIALPLATTPTPKKFTKYKAIWDTGATNSVITSKVAVAVGLVPTGKIKSRGVHGEQIVNTYIVDIGLPNKVCINDVKVSEGELMDNIDVLIGMDIIQMGDFAISNAGGKTTFSFCIPPHKNPMDLLEKSNQVNPKLLKPALPIPTSGTPLPVPPSAAGVNPLT